MYSAALVVVVVACVSALCLVSRAEVAVETPISVGSRSVLRSIEEGGGGEKRDYAVELNATNFDSVLKETPATYALVEFYAHWCPACRKYKPQYEKVAKLFNGGNAAHPGFILMVRVDCAFKINSKLCSKFSVEYFPLLLWGSPSKFVYGSWDPKQDSNEIRAVDDGRTSQRLLNWINKQTNRSYDLDDKKYEHEHFDVISSDPEQIASAIYDVEEATYIAIDIILQHKMIKPETRPSLVKFLQLLVVHHPSRRCRKGTAEILVDFDDFPLLDKENASSRDVRICGKDVPRGYWGFCRGSMKDTRGFSCGLWVLFHSLSVRVSDEEVQTAFTAVCIFVREFFVCQECRQHFHEMCSSVEEPFGKSRDFVLWLWSAHNRVNERLMKEEEESSRDPKFPKMVWPPPALCPSCKNDGVGWNHDEVHKFLVGYYGEKLVKITKIKEGITDKSTGGGVELDEVSSLASSSSHAIMVPVGAALGIAVASCAFGALACYWRQQQKNRKPRRSWNN